MEHKTEFWAAHVAALKVAKIDASEYARRHELTVKSLYYWRRKLTVSTEAHPTITQASSLVQGNKFVALQLATPRPPGCVLHLPSGHRLEMTALPSADWLADFLRASQFTQGAH